MSKKNTVPIVIQNIRDMDLQGKTVFMRLDFNVPLSEPNAKGEREITNDNRIREALPTIRLALEKGAKLILASHLGRPKGQKNPKDSLEPVARHLAEILDVDVTLADDCKGDGIMLMARSLKPGQILMLENLRFYNEEEANDSHFSHDLAQLAQVYITDAFGTAHRKHASTYGVPSLMEQRGAGLLIEKELKFLDRLLHNPDKPFYMVLGGAKVSDKIKTIESLMRNVDGICVGGAMAFAFMAALGQTVPAGAKVPSTEDIEAAKNILREAKKKELPILLPIDMVESFDIGPETVKKFSEFLSRAKTIFWNGPMGWFEKPDYAKGTYELAQRVAEFSALKVVGGGDTVSAIESAGVSHQYDHLSTGGGAVLEYLEGNGLPGIDVLKTKAKTAQPLQYEDDDFNE